MPTLVRSGISSFFMPTLYRATNSAGAGRSPLIPQMLIIIIIHTKMKREEGEEGLQSTQHYPAWSLTQDTRNNFFLALQEILRQVREVLSISLHDGGEWCEVE